MITTIKSQIDSCDSCRYLHLKPELASRPYQKPVPLVLLHGMFGGLSNFDGIAQRLVKTGVEVWIPELPFFELSTSLTVQALGDWLTEFLTEMGINEPVLLGNSMGGHLALDVCIRKGLAVRALVLTGSSGLFEEHFGESTPRRYDRKYVRKRIEQTFEHYEVTDQMIDEVMEILGDRKKLIKMVSLARSTHKYNMRSKLSRIDCPVQLIWGKQDQITPPDVAKEFHALIENAQLTWIEDCGHAPMMEHPRRFFAELKIFIDCLGQSPISTNNNPNI